MSVSAGRSAAPHPAGAAWPAARHIAVAIFLTAALSIWQIYSLFLPPVLLPGPARVILRFIAMWSERSFLAYAIASLVHVLASVAISFTLGVAIALAGYFSPTLRPAIYARLAPFLNSFSGIGWAFLALIWFGINGGAVIFATSVALLPLVIINAGAGFAELNGETLEMATSFSRRSGRHVALVILPMLFPYLFATFRLCIGIAWQIVLTAELLCGSRGLGTVIDVARARYATDMLFAVVLLVVIVVFVCDRLVFATLQTRLRKTYEV